MKNLLVCSIIRDSRPHLERWFQQIASLCGKLSGEYRVFLAVYENDSKDGTAEWLKEFDCYPNGLNRIIVCEKIGTQKYGSVWSEDRIRNLANARQKCLDLAEAKWGLKTFHKIAYIEPDVSYNPEWCKELVLARHPLSAGFGEPDIYSGWALRSESNPKESMFLYDTTACRQKESDVCWNFDKENAWRDNSRIFTNFGGADGYCLHFVWSTFNCFCVYNAAPFQQGLRWGFVNKRLNTGQKPIDGGWLDVDTSVICEDFREMGYIKVFINTNCIVRHA